jgi:endogenous inhibitor of DNA gyrase (YacG/DUF329 family)
MIDWMDQPALCVLCRARAVDQRWRPFCSQRCQQQDQARWADGAYRVAGPSAVTFPDPPHGDDEDDG